jgi:(p)ppGpp synthase/HD superfamily hydrolase
MTQIFNSKTIATATSVANLAQELHEGQFDKGGHPYFLHVEAVGLSLRPFGEKAMMAGYLHDSIEDTGITIKQLRENHGVPESVLEAVKMVSRNLYPEESTYMDMIRKIATDGSYTSRLVKIADNAHNSRLDRKIEGMSEDALDFSRKRYAKARTILYPSVKKEDITRILDNINPHLLHELR